MELLSLESAIATQNYLSNFNKVTLKTHFLSDILVTFQFLKSEATILHTYSILLSL